MVRQREAEDAAVEAAVDQLNLGGIEQVIQYTEDVRAAVGEGKLTLTSSAGKVRIYNRETGVPSDVLTDQLKSHLKKRFPSGHHLSGQLVFSLQPTVDPPMGMVMCLLHPDHPDRPYLDSVGLKGKFCYSEHIASEFDLEGHMRHRHSKEWAVIERAQKRQSDDEGRQLLRQQTELLARMSGQTPNAPVVYPCYESGCTRFFDTAQGLRLHQTKEHRGGQETN
jgi:hypothetical protein